MIPLPVPRVSAAEGAATHFRTRASLPTLTLVATIRVVASPMSRPAATVLVEGRITVSRASGARVDRLPVTTSPIVVNP